MPGMIYERSRRMQRPDKLSPLALPHSDPQVGFIRCLVLTQGGVEIRQVHLLFLENQFFLFVCKSKKTG